MKPPGISRILNLRIALVVFCVNVFVCICFIWGAVQLTDRDFHKIIKLQSKHLTDTFTQQLWLFDLGSTELLAAMAVDTPDIVGLRLYDQDNNVLVDKGAINKNSHMYVHRELVHEGGTVVGSLDLEFTNRDQYKQQNLILMISLFIVLATMIGTSFLIHRVLRRYLVRPLHNLQGDMNNLAGGEFHPTRLSAHSREVQGIIDVYNDMAAALADREEKRQRAERNSRESQLRYLSLFQSSNDSIFTMTREGFLVDVNPAMLKLLGYSREEIGNLGMADLFDTEGDLERLQQEVESKESVSDYQVRLRDRDGNSINCLLSASVWRNDEDRILGFQGILRDITEQIRAGRQQAKLEQELRQKYKMEAVGLMAGGIAHNFNNNLAIILGNLELAQMRCTGDAKMVEHLDNAVLAIHRSRDLTKQILTYSRRDSHDLVVVQPVLIIDETLKLIRSTIPTSVSLDFQVLGDLDDIRIEADATRVQEALINLCNNSVQAMDESGRLAIRLSTVALSENDIPARFQCMPGGFVELRVEDDGCGMAPEIVERIFDPFFTTKPVDQGTGMGLSTVQGIVEQHKGFIKVESREGEGTTFSLFFPVYGSPAGEPSQPHLLQPRYGTERILFVDDDAMLVHLGEALLATLGYQVVAETDPVKALELLRQEPCPFDLLITDQTMPGLTGLELTEELHRLRPGFPVILCTGYSSKASAEEVDFLGIDSFCMKPLELAVLAEEIRRVLDKETSNG